MAKYKVIDLLLVLDMACAKFRELFFSHDNNDVASGLFNRELLGEDLFEMLKRAVSYIRDIKRRDFGELDQVCKLGFAIFETWSFLYKYESPLFTPAEEPILAIADDLMTYFDKDGNMSRILRPSKGQMAMIIVTDFINDDKNHQGMAEQAAMDMLSKMPPGLEMFHQDLIAYRVSKGLPSHDSWLMSTIRTQETERAMAEKSISDMIDTLCRPMGFQYAPLHLLARFSMCPPNSALVLKNSRLLGAIRRSSLIKAPASDYKVEYDPPTQEEINGISADLEKIEKSVKWLLERAEGRMTPLTEHASFIIHHAICAAWCDFSDE